MRGSSQKIVCKNSEDIEYIILPGLSSAFNA